MAHGENAAQQRNREWWSRRPGINGWSISSKPGENRKNRRFTHKIERKQGIAEIKKRLNEE